MPRAVARYSQIANEIRASTIRVRGTGHFALEGWLRARSLAPFTGPPRNRPANCWYFRRSWWLQTREAIRKHGGCLNLPAKFLAQRTRHAQKPGSEEQQARRLWRRRAFGLERCYGHGTAINH